MIACVTSTSFPKHTCTCISPDQCGCQHWRTWPRSNTSSSPRHSRTMWPSGARRSARLVPVSTSIRCSPQGCPLRGYDATRIISEAAEDDAREGSRRLEIQIDPTSYAPFVGGITPALEIVLDEARRAPEATGVEVGVVVAASRIRHPLEARTPRAARGPVRRRQPRQRRGLRTIKR